jgi:poly-gamma-glutamate synthesis protein (capsule biosynthesis protein)
MGRTSARLTAAAVLLFALAGAAAEPRKLDVVLTGQSLLQSDFRVAAPGAVAVIRPLLEGDVVFTNFETTVHEPGEPLTDLDHVGGVYAPPQALDALQALGFNLLALSNNHSYDIGPQGIRNTLAEVDARKLAHAGLGLTPQAVRAPGYLQVGGTKVALVSMASGLIRPGASEAGLNEIHMEGGKPDVDAGHPRPADAEAILASIREAAGKADLVIAYHHNHVYDRDFVKMMASRAPERLVPPPWIKSWAHQEIDAGADIVVLHGAPLVQGVEIYHGRPIFYDLGNFIFQLPLRIDATNLFEPNVWDSVVAHANFEGKTLTSITFQPIVLNTKGQGEGDLALATRGLPAPAHGELAQQILQRLVAASRAMGTQIVIKGEVAELTLQGGKR